MILLGSDNCLNDELVPWRNVVLDALMNLLIDSFCLGPLMLGGELGDRVFNQAANDAKVGMTIRRQYVRWLKVCF